VLLCSNGLDDGSQIDAILLDFSKAFDKVPHQRLLCKLNHYRVGGQVLNWTTSFLAECCVWRLCLYSQACHQWRPTGDSTGTTSFPRLHQRSTFPCPVHTKAVCRWLLTVQTYKCKKWLRYLTKWSRSITGMGGYLADVFQSCVWHGEPETPYSHHTLSITPPWS